MSERAISVSECIGKGYGSGWFTNCKCRYRIFIGGRSTKKSVNIGGYEPIFKILSDSNRNIIMSRQDDTNNSSSTYPNLIATIWKLGLQNEFKPKVSPYEIIYKKTGQKIIFKGCNNPAALTSTKFAHGELTDIYFEEASELNSYDAFRQIDGSVRSQFSDLQITMLMNGWDKKSWIYDIFFAGRLEDDYEYLETHDYQDYTDPEFNIGQGKGLYLHKSTFRINEFRADYKDESMRILKEKDFKRYCVEGLGMWGNTSEQTYENFKEDLIISHAQAMGNVFGSYSIGIDIGMGNGEGRMIKNTKDNPERVKSAMTMELVGMTADYGKLIPLDEYFHSNASTDIKKTSVQIADEMVQKIQEWIELYKFHPVLMKGTIVVYVESADPGGYINMLQAKAKSHRLYNIRFMTATKNRINTRVDYTNLLMAYGDFQICNKCKNLIREIKNARQSADGRVREDIDDHSINACEYAWIPLLPKMKQWKEYKEH